MMRRLAALWLSALLSLLAGGARADTPVTLFKSYAGNVNFVGTQESMRVRGNNKDPCAVVSSTTELTARLADLPAGAEVLSAQLYWAGSNVQAKADYRITFEGAELTAEAARQYFSPTVGDGSDYFGGAVDVTAQVSAKRNGDYTFSGLTINNGTPWCSFQGVLGGFSLLVIYAHPDQPYRVLNLYEGFQYIRYSGITLNLNNFLVPTPLAASATGRLGHITWEGDSTLDQGGEELLFNGYEMVDRLNKAGNQFNSKSNINDDATSYGIDFDAYTVQSPVIQAGQTAATTRYQSGQDLVLLNAEIVALPNVPTADLLIALTRNGELKVGTATTYTLTASNAGPSTETGPVTVSATMPDNLTLVSASGSGWNCTTAGQALSCSASGPLKKGESLAPITLTVQARSEGAVTVTVKVAGKLFDNVSSNNTVSNSGTAAAAGPSAFVFTVGSCKAGIAIGAEGQCSALGAVVAAGAKIDLHVTAVSDEGIPKALDAKIATAVPLRFSLSCAQPAQNAGVGAVYGALTLPLCEANGQVPGAASESWSGAASLSFAAGSASARLGDFQYQDVGKVTLNLIDAANKTVSASFVSKPVSLDLVVSRNSDGGANPAVKNGDLYGFVRAGEAFTLQIRALTETGAVAPNFGNDMLKVGLSQGEVSGQPLVQGSFQLEKGVWSGNDFLWDDVGTVQIKPILMPDDYLGAGSVPSTLQPVGRFYPAYLQTKVVANFSCLPGMNCPAGLSGAAYSRQPFNVTVEAFSLRDTRLVNYQGVNARVVTLSAYDSPGGTGSNPGGGTLTAPTFTPAAGAGVKAEYKLLVPFSGAVPRAAWGAPASIYLRAEADEKVAVTATTIRTEKVSSRREPATAVEGGIRIVNGRLLLAHAFGSELLRLPVPMNAQYWTGAAWANNSGDSQSKVEFFIDYTSCANKLAVAGRAAPDNCNLQLLKPQSPFALLKDGVGKLWLGAPGAGNLGSAWLQVKDAGVPAWLPSTRARAVFGVHKSPLIYVREVY
ncbi:MAG TPA: DUF6701 domain-containing protein [Telluria sp.]